MEYAVYPFDYMRITQAHDEGNHIPHWKDVTNYSDKPWDEASKDGGRQYFIPQNNYVIETDTYEELYEILRKKYGKNE